MRSRRRRSRVRSCLANPGWAIGQALHGTGKGTFGEYLNQLHHADLKALRLGKKTEAAIVEAEALHKQLDRYAYGPPPIRFSEQDVDTPLGRSQRAAQHTARGVGPTDALTRGGRVLAGCLAPSGAFCARPAGARSQPRPPARGARRPIGSLGAVTARLRGAVRRSKALARSGQGDTSQVRTAIRGRQERRRRDPEAQGGP
jgi:hypothetical protein